MKPTRTQSYLLNKPFQVLSQFSPEGDKRTLKDIFTGIPKDVYPVGRLDYDSEGLLFLTNDRTLNQRLLDPAYAHQRTYWVQVEGLADADQLEALRRGVSISIKGKSIKTRPAEVAYLGAVDLWERNPPIRYRKHIPTTWLSLSLREGKNRQVRRMTAAVGLPTLRLVRYQIGQLTLGGLKPGDWRPVTEEEVSLLFLP